MSGTQPRLDTVLRFPFETPDLIELPAEFARLRTDRPVARVTLPTGDRAWLVTRHDDVKAVLADPRFSRAAAARPGAPRLRPVPPDRSSIMSLDPPEHTRLRRLVARAFATGQIDALRPRVESVTDELLDRMAGSPPPVDLVAALAAPLAITTICEILGVPAQRRADFQRWTNTMLALGAGTDRAIVEAREALLAYLSSLVDAKRSQPGEDLLSALTAVHEQGDRLSREELLTFGTTLLTAGYHTVAAGIANGSLALLRHGLLRVLHERPELVPAAVEELLRYTPGAASGGTIRIALEDVTLAGQTVRAGEAVIPAISSANRDERVFAQPDRLRLDRDGDRQHLAFGYGIHHCLGSRLARLELRTAIGGLAHRFPALRLAVAAQDLDWGGSAMIRAPRTLPVSW